MENIAQLITNYGVMVVIVVVFLWDYINNKKKLVEDQDTITNTLLALNQTLSAISNCLQEIKQSNSNTSKSLEILQNQLENTDKKIDDLSFKKKGDY